LPLPCTDRLNKHTKKQRLAQGGKLPLGKNEAEKKIREGWGRLYILVEKTIAAKKNKEKSQPELPMEETLACGRARKEARGLKEQKNELAKT